MRWLDLRWAIPFLLAPLILACGDSAESGRNLGDAGGDGSTGDLQENAEAIPAEHVAGAEAYTTWCAECHGERGEGTDQGPPHVHVVYEPGHHPDESFVSAARIGVRAHHWNFGDMEPVEGVTDDELEAIVAYVRWLQSESGIY